MAFVSQKIPDELLPYKEKLSPRFYEVRKKVIKFMMEDIAPARKAYAKSYATLTNKWAEPPMLNELRAKAKARGLWNFFLPEVSGLTVLEYAPIAELLGAMPLCNAAMNCSAPDTGNMEVLEKYGTPEQKKKWLEPLLNAEIRSCFAMTEPGVASSDATQIGSSIVRDGDEYVINGHKWYISGAMRPECKLIVFLGKSDPTAPRHKQQSTILIPKDAPGVNIIRAMHVFGHAGDHAEIIFDNVRVPVGNMVLGEGRGFEIAQGRLGPGRIHHCMRSVGVAEMALSSMIYRARNRSAFGSLLANKDTIRHIIGKARLEITKCRQLCYLAACIMDDRGAKGARKYIAMIKYAAPKMAFDIIDEAIQMHGAHGVSQDSRLQGLWKGIRTLRVADGPDVVHLLTIAKSELASNHNPLGASISGTNKNIAKYGKFEKSPFYAHL